MITLHHELEQSDVYSRECTLGDAWVIIDNFVKRLDVLENEAQDLIELQELLEANVVNFSLLPQCRVDLNNLKQVWETVRLGGLFFNYKLLKNAPNMFCTRYI